MDVKQDEKKTVVHPLLNIHQQVERIRMATAVLCDTETTQLCIV